MPPLLTYSAARRALAIAVAGTALAAPAQAARPAATSFDARPGNSGGAPGQATKELRKALGAQGLVSSDPRTGTVRAAGKLDGALTGPSGKGGAAIALGYLREHGPALGLPAGEAPGLALERRTVSDGGLEVLTWRQRRGGIPSADTYLRAAVDDEGRLLSLGGAPAAELDPPTLTPDVTAAAALSAVSGVPAPKGKRRGNDPEQHTTFAGGATASLVLYQDGDGARLGWRVVAPLGPDELADAIVDAAHGSVIKRANRVKSAVAPGNALVFPASPDSGPQAERSLGQWGTAANRLLGTRVHAFPDPDDLVGTESDPVAPLEVGDWDDPLVEPDCDGGILRCTWTQQNRLVNRDHSATQLYYFVNTFLDHLAAAPIGFTDATGGFGPGDRIFAQSSDSAAKPGGVNRNNASFIAYPDGGPGLLDVFLFDAADNRLDGVNDPSLVYHEVAHGLSERLVTDGQGAGALNDAQAWAIGEGTSDFYALDFLVKQGFETPPGVKFGTYLGDWLRDTPIDGDTLAYGPLVDEPHTDGEIVAQTLWSLREEVGGDTARRLLTDALRIAPPEPSFLDLRNALLIVSTSAATDKDVWKVFAARGMGYFASSVGAGDLNPEPDTVDPNEPPDDLEPGTLRGTVRDEDGRPVAGADVGIGGWATGGLGPFVGATTGADGRYAIQGFQGADHAVITAAKPAYESDEATGVHVGDAEVVQDFTLLRDFSSAAGGAAVENFTGPDNAGFGCGPGGLIDDARDTVWSTDRATRSVVVDLGATVDVAAIRIDPAAGCGDDDASSLGSADLLVAGAPDTPFAPLSSPTFVPGDLGNLESAFAGTRAGVRFVKLVAKTPQSPAGTGADFIDVAELQVLKKPGTPVGPTADTGVATAIGPAGATLTGTVAPNGGPAPDVVFEYGRTAAYGSLVAASGSPAVRAAVTGLEPSTTYHYRVVALRDGRRYEGGNATFTTGPATEPPPPPPPPEATSASIAGRKVTATRKGRFKVKVRFDAGAPEGSAHVQAKIRGKVVARGTRAVAPGETRRVTMWLNKAGRKAIRPGRSRKVKIVVRLPEGDPVRKTLTVARKR